MKYDTAAHGQSVDLSAMNELVSAAMPSYLLQDVIDPWASGTFSSDGRSFHQARFGPPPRAHSFIYAARLTLSRRRQEGEEAVEAKIVGYFGLGPPTSNIRRPCPACLSKGPAYCVSSRGV